MLATPDLITVHPNQSNAAALTHLADKLTEVMDVNLALLNQSDEAEPVHKTRVALRRFRALVAAFEPILDEDLADALKDRSRALFRILAAIRDADVMAARFATSDRAKATAKEAALQRIQGRKLLKKKRADGFRPWVLKRLSGKSWQRSGKKAKILREGSVTVLAHMALDRAWASAVSNGPDFAAMSLRARHDLRKDLKMLRYLCEFFADLWPGAAQDAFLADLRALQDDLGELTDTAMAKALGHDVGDDTSAFQTRAANAWAKVLADGPWWVTAAG